MKKILSSILVLPQVQQPYLPSRTSCVHKGRLPEVKEKRSFLQKQDAKTAVFEQQEAEQNRQHEQTTKHLEKLYSEVIALEAELLKVESKLRSNPTSTLLEEQYKNLNDRIKQKQAEISNLR